MPTTKTVLLLHKGGDDTLSHALEQAGYGVTSCPSTESALEVIWSEGPPIAAVITDITGVAGESAWKIASEARRKASNVCVIYITGDGPYEWAALGVPDSVLIRQPAVPFQVVTALTELMNRRDSMREPDLD
jgi:DNA-binding NtrC family response regulator